MFQLILLGTFFIMTLAKIPYNYELLSINNNKYIFKYM